MVDENAIKVMLILYHTIQKYKISKKYSIFHQKGLQKKVKKRAKGGVCRGNLPFTRQGDFPGGNDGEE